VITVVRFNCGFLWTAVCNGDDNDEKNPEHSNKKITLYRLSRNLLFGKQKQFCIKVVPLLCTCGYHQYQTTTKRTSV
jgi:hypothetical protein